MAVNPSVPKQAPVIKNVATAPIILCDAAPVFGHKDGLVQVTLASQALGLKSDNTVSVDLLAVAHLRCTAVAAQNLRDALDKAIGLMADKPPEGEKTH